MALKIKEQALADETWTSVAITNAALTRFTLSLRTAQAWRIAYSDPGTWDSETGPFFSLSAGSVWAEALGGQLPNKTIWVGTTGGANTLEISYAYQGTES